MYLNFCKTVIVCYAKLRCVFVCKYYHKNQVEKEVRPNRRQTRILGLSPHLLVVMVLTLYWQETWISLTTDATSNVNLKALGIWSVCHEQYSKN